MKKIILLLILITLLLVSCTRDRSALGSNYQASTDTTSVEAPTRVGLSDAHKNAHPGKAHILRVGDSTEISLRTCDNEVKVVELSVISTTDKIAVFNGLNPENQSSGAGGLLTNKPYCNNDEKSVLAVYVTSVTEDFVEIYVYDPYTMGVVETRFTGHESGTQ
ncbi:hypothetical protein COY32_01640 [candidate division WWE3 bacterium CG_4_10_14_0_2_um_filter_41_14]|uniref:Uncharacterized protein n=1 Tax=candidate division WWE3 bacterium CG_4_10_14_0_2_um_filter_41_14 TaxID=1975072 RepID=A0A2M7TKN3_UNCKA|nr:MAG: hypothetical protein COY32_01640 [candidate division WWE3 bacterium CG_4_10_14_0_2_um_filter_41_14]